MNGLQLSYFFTADAHTAKYFKGIVMRDTDMLPSRNSSAPALYILNTDSEAGKGEHWCAAFYHGQQCEFFDPFGMPPEFYGFERILRTRAARYRVHNNICVQSIASMNCGHHCLFFGFHRCRGFLLSKIINMYKSDDLAWNDKMVLNFVLDFGTWFKSVV